MGIGASAGGLEALRALFGAFKTKPRNMSFVVVQHLAPLHRSRLVELIASSTQLTVSEVQDGTRPQPGVIYITPPNANILSENGRLRLKATQAGPKPSIDTFFRSLASDRGNCAIAVVLSGTGSDGSTGIRAIKAAGGLTICQDVQSSKYDGMPKAALHTGAIDYSLAPEEIARELARFDELKPPVRIVKRPSSSDPYEEIMHILERQAGVSFSRYKQSTIRRRMERRLAATRCDTLGDYAQYLESTPGEAQNLMQDILISVTSFFRDGEAFKALSQAVTERLKAKRDGGHFRCWVIGCATGEEAYSIAILLSEALEKVRRNVHLQIFATDLDEQALAVARRGVYSKSSFAGIPRKLLDKYFTPLDDGYQVRPSLRDSIVFARHNATEDAPFLNLDLASCRNVLIYFNNKLQEHIFATLQYAITKGGVLFLGKSEAVPGNNRSFELASNKYKIYTRVAVKGEIPRTAPRIDAHREANREAALITSARDAGHSVDLFNALVSGLAPDSIIVDGEQYIKHVFGDAGRYLSHPQGKATQNLTKLLPPDLGMDVASLLHRASSTQRTTTGRRHELPRRGGKVARTVQVAVVPLSSGNPKEYLVCFHGGVSEARSTRRSPRELAGLSAEQRAEQLQKELERTREHLQTVLEEQETASEELQSLNEELQSSNEELQSSNEELETTNEELQSANEELTTVNEELNVKSGELQSLNQRLQAIQSSIIYPLLIIDRNRRLMAFNPAARSLLRLTDADMGIDVKAIGSIADVRNLVRMIDDAFTRKTEPRIQVEIRERSFEAQVQIFRNVKGGLDGVVASLVENTDIVKALEESRLHRQRLSNILEGTPAIVTMKDLAGIYTYANQRFADMLGLPSGEIVGKNDEELFGAETAAAAQEHDYEIIRKKRALEFIETYTVAGARRIWHSSKFPLFDNRKRVQSVCNVCVDMTERLEHEEQLDLFRRAVSASNTGVLLLEPHGTNGEEELRARFASDQVSTLTGIPEGRLIGVGLKELMRRLRVKQKPEQIDAMVQRMSTESDCTFTLPIGRAISGETWLEMHACRVRLKDSDGRDADPKQADSKATGHLMLTFVDVTQRLRDQRTIATQQEELEKVSRFSALTEIAAGIAHEVNTPLSVIMTKTGILKTLAKQERIEGFAATGVADDIARMAKSVSEIVHGLSSLVSRNGDRLETSNLRRIVGDAAKMCESRFHRFGVELRLDLDGAEGSTRDLTVECYPVQILQVVINLLNNAVDAVSEQSDRWVKVSLRGDAHHAEITVTDSGSGIDSRLAEKIFTPFFSTKKDREGTGIGLSLSRSIARRHNGELSLDAGMPNTSFRLSLPRRVGAAKTGQPDLVASSQ